MMKYAQKIRGFLENRNIQNYAIVIAVVAMFITIFSVWPFATDGYEDVSDRATLDQRIATAIANNQETVMIDYSGEDWQNLKSWLKEDFRYPILSQYTNELAIYNYDKAKFTYWTYGDKKRVKITISYKLNTDQIAAVNAYADNLINSNGLRNMNQYDQILFVHDYLINNFSYDVGANNLYQMIQDGKTNCYGYTMMNYVILSRLGIDIRTTYGRMNNSHIWNAVNLNGTWYYEDITWDTVTKGTEYFLISSATLQKTHTIEGNFIPDCPIDYQVVPPAKVPELNEEVVVEETTEETTEENAEETTEVATDTAKGEVSTETDEVDSDKAIEAAEKPEDSSFRGDNDTNTSDSTPTKPTVPKSEKLQKLTKLLKALKALKNK